MKLDGAEIRNILTLCADINAAEKDKELKVNIPYYQRPYKWEKEQISNLVNDFKKNLDSGENDDYFIGSVVLVKEKADDNINVIDGQQRITTIFLLNYLKFLITRSYIEELLGLRKYSGVINLLTKLSKEYYHIIDRSHKVVMNNLIETLSAI